MNYKSDSNYSCFFVKTKSYINQYWKSCMERMKSYTTSCRVKYWCRKKMIYINNHSNNHNKSCFFSIFTKKYIGNYTWQDKMKTIVNNLLEHIEKLILPSSPCWASLVDVDMWKSLVLNSSYDSLCQVFDIFINCINYISTSCSFY